MAIFVWRGVRRNLLVHRPDPAIRKCPFRPGTRNPLTQSMIGKTVEADAGAALHS